MAAKARYRGLGISAGIAALALAGYVFLDAIHGNASSAGMYGICTKNEVVRLLDAGFPQPDVRRLCVTHEMPSAARKRAGTKPVPKPSGGLLHKDPNPPAPPKKKVVKLIELPPIAEWRGVGASPDRARWQPAYDAEGRPLSDADLRAGKKPAVQPKDFPRRVVPVSNAKALLKAIQEAKPGDYIEVQPGTYRLSPRRGIACKRKGKAEAPIAVGAKELGTVTIQMATFEGFIVESPFWIFENLDITEKCSGHVECVHAFHVAGKGRSVVIRNNRMFDFHSQLKANGVHEDHPDFGLVESNTIYDTRSRRTRTSVNKININTADGWMVRGNLIADFHKLGGNNISFGGFMKGNSRGGVFDGNVVACYMNTVHKIGVRLGLSFGGGGTGKQFCRDFDCTAEHTDGIMRNNIIVNCPIDVGVYLNRAKNTLFHNNILLNTRGIDSRFHSSSVRVVNNILDARIKERDGGKASADHNLMVSGKDFDGMALQDLFVDLGNLDVAFTEKGRRALKGKGVALPGADLDICGNKRDPASFDIGPIALGGGPPCTPNAIDP